MPISRQEFDEGSLRLSIPIIQYLRVRSEEAFTSDEILEALLDVYERRATPAEVVLTLDDLVASGSLESRKIDGVWMYTIAR